MSVFVKICGIMRLADAQVALDAGADALGFNFSRTSKRRVEIRTARKIVDALAPEVLSIGVFVNSERHFIEQVVSEVGLRGIQFHGEEHDELLFGWGELAVYRAVPGESIEQATSAIDSAFRAGAKRVLIDAKVGSSFGGTGERVDKSLLRNLSQGGLLDNCLIAGGLNPNNVQEVVREFSPFGVDVSSGVESAPGVKDSRLVRQFLHNAKSI